MKKSPNVGLKLARKLVGINQLEACKLAGISQTYLSQIECGQRKPSNDVMERLCGVYGVPRLYVEWLGYGGEGVKEGKEMVYEGMRGIFDKWMDEIFMGS